MPPRKAQKRVQQLPTLVEKLVKGAKLKRRFLHPKQIAVLKRLSKAEVSALISARRKARGTLDVAGRRNWNRCGFIPL
jgi:hypothetical protein